MGKVLLTKKNYKEHLTIIDQTVYMEGDFIVTPGVKDLLRNQGIAIKYGRRPQGVKHETCSDTSKTPDPVNKQVDKCGQNNLEEKLSAEEVACTVRQVLENSFDTVDENMIEEVLRRLLKVYTF